MTSVAGKGRGRGWKGTAFTRFWGKVDKGDGDGCWMWVGARYKSGYGMFWVNGRKVRAQRWAWEHQNGPVPEGMGVCHYCDTPACVRPSHLFLGDQFANMRDAANKGRNHITSLPGERHPNARFTDKQVMAMRERWRRGGISLREMARQYTTSDSTIHGIVSGRSWKHLLVEVDDE